MGKLAIHGQSYKKEQLSALNRHNLRLNQNYSNEFIDKARTNDNIILIEPAGGLRKAARKRLEEAVLPYAKRKLRSDANWVSEFVITLPNEVTQPQDIKKYCEVIINHFAEKVGTDNLLSAVIHMDETTPHLHLDFIPIKDHKLTSKEVMTRSFLLSLHDDLPQLLQKAGFETERGSAAGTTAEHIKKSRDIKTYKQDMEREKLKLQKEISLLRKARELLQFENYNFALKIVEQFKHLHLDKER
jgi:hypothetical protein